MLIQRMNAYRSELTIWHRFDIQHISKCSFSSILIVEITCKLRFFCTLIDYRIDHRKIIKLITSNSTYSFVFVFVFYAHYDIFNFSNDLFNHLIMSHRDHTQKLLEELLEKLFEELLEELLDGEFSRIACLFHYEYYEIEFMTKDIC